MGNNNIIENIGKAISKENVMEDLPLPSKRWRKLNPIYELITATIGGFINDDIIAQKIEEAKNEDEVFGLLSIQSLTGRLKKEKVNQIEDRLKKGDTIDEVIDFTALQIAEGKRTRNGNVLYQINDLPQKTQKDFYEKIRKISLDQIYISKEVSDYLKTNEKEFRKNRIIKYSIIAALISGFLIGSYFFKKKYDIKIEKQPEVIYEYIDTISLNRNF